MDDIVIAALRKWPDVPACFGWLGLDQRGDWWLRDAEAQARGPFPTPRGSRIEHRRLIEFIGRNYAADALGRWYFQNGPQRVYVELEAAPLVALVQAEAGGWRISSHHGLALSQPQATLVDEAGRLFLPCEQGLAIVRSMDMDAAADALEAGHWPAPEEVEFTSLARRCRHQLHPAP
jgi:Protein of unknown function (DUF2946)